MNHLSLFSGIGGLDLAAEWAGFTTVAFVERDPYCQRVLAKRWPGVPILEDVRLVGANPDGERQLQQGGLEPQQRRWVGDVGGEIRLVSGGFPCQPHSVAGKRQASSDDRDLWPEVARVLREIRPRWFVGENVRGLLHSESGRFFGRVLGDLADLGYSVGWGVWGAADVGALHLRERVFIVGHDSNAEGGTRQRPASRQAGHAAQLREDVADAGRAGREERDPAAIANGTRYGAWCADASGGGWEFEPAVGRVADGVPGRVDRLRALGNAVVPQQAFPLFQAIAEFERMKLHPISVDQETDRG